MQNKFLKTINRSISLLGLFAIAFVFALITTHSAKATSVGIPWYEPWPDTYVDGGDLKTAPQSTLWDAGSGSSGDIHYKTNSALSYSGLLTTVGSGGVHFESTQTSSAKQRVHQFSAFANPGTDGTSVYMSFLLKLNSTPGVNRGFISLSSGSGWNTSRALNVFIDPTGALGISKSSGTAIQSGLTSPLTLGATNLVVVRYRYLGVTSGTDDAVDLWLNPSISDFANDENSVPTPTITATPGGTDATSIRTLGLYTGQAGSACDMDLDEIRADSTWAAVLPLGCFGPTVGANADSTIYESGTASFTVALTGSDDSSPTPLQWQVSTNAGTTWENISGATSSTYTTNNVQQDANGYLYQLVASNNCNSTVVTSSVATLTVNPCVDIAITSQPTNTTVGGGETANFSVTADGSQPTYQWQLSTDSGATFANIGGATASSYTTPALGFGDDGNQYQVVISNQCDLTYAVSTVVTASVQCVTASFTTQPDNAYTVEGSSAAFSVGATGSFLTYQWETNGVADAGATSASYTTPSLLTSDSGMTVDCIISAPCDGLSVTSSVVTASVGAASDASYRSAASGNWSGTSTWEVSTDGGSTWNATISSPTSGNNTNTVVRNGHVVTVTASVATDETSVETGGEIDVNSSVTLTVDGSGTQLDVFGIVKNAGTVSGSGTVVFENGGKYQHNWTAAGATLGSQLGTIPDATWATGSTCEIIGFTAPSTDKLVWLPPNGLSQAFHNFTWNCPTLSKTVVLGGALTNIGGDLLITNGAGGNAGVSLGTNNVGGTTIAVAGNVDIYGPNKVLLNSAGTATNTVQIGGNLSINAGSLFDGFGDAASSFEFSGADATYTRTAAIGEDGTQQSINYKVNVGAKLTLVGGSIQVGFGKTAFYPRSITVDGTLDLNGTTTNAFSQLIGASTGVITNSGAATTLTLGNTGGTVTTSTFDGVIAGDIALTKTSGAGANTLVLSGSSPNTHTGANTVSAGVLSVAKDGGLSTSDVSVANGATLQLTNGTSNDYIADAASVSIGSTATVALDYTGANDTVYTLQINGVYQPSGESGSAASGAANQPSQFTGVGKLTVTLGTPQITSSPASTNVTVTENAVFTASATGSPAPSAAQWQVSTNGGSNFSDLPGENADTLTFAVLGTQDGNQYRAVYTNSYGTSISGVATLNVTCPAIDLTPETLSAATVGSSYSDTVIASGGVSPYSYTVTSGALPAGVNLATGGALSGTSTASGVFNFTVTATDANGCSGSSNYSVTATCPTISLEPATLASGNAGTVYTDTLSGAGGTAPYAFAVTGGSLPDGLNLASGGALTGTPTIVSNYSFTVTATDAYGCSGSSNYSINVSCSTIVVGPATLPDAEIGVAYNQTNAATGGIAPYTYAVTSNSLLEGLNLDPSSGVITGTATNFVGSTNFVITATDANGCTGSTEYTNTVVCPTISLAALPDSSPGATYTNSAAASGGSTPYTYAVTGGAVPTGTALDGGTGSLEGTTTGGGTFNFTITATDVYGCTGSSNYTVNVVCPSITVSASMPDAIKNVTYSNSVSASGGQAPYTYAVTGGTLPSGTLILSPAGVLSGKPNAYGIFTYTITATDVFGCSGSQSYTQSVVATSDPNAPVVTILSPKNNGYTEETSIVVTGKVTDSVFTTNVEVSVDGGAFVPANLSGATATAYWYLDIGALAASVGTNLHTMAVQATDVTGNTSVPKTNSFYYGVRQVLTIVSNGVYDFKPTPNSIYGIPTNTAQLVVGKTYKFKVSTPKVGDGTNYLYSNIVSSADGPSTLTTYSFVMTSNLVVDVNFVANQFYAVAGTYNGLFDAGELSLSNRGFFTAKVTAKNGKPATFSGKVQVNGYKWPFKGTFDLNGLGVSTPVSRIKWDPTETDLQVNLQLAFGGNTISGSVSNVDWLATLSGDLASTTTNYDGLYTLSIPGDAANSATVPGGSGYGLVSVLNGTIKLTGSKLADGQSFAQNVPVSVNGDWPLYSWSHKDVNKQYQGAIMGWLSLANGGLTNSTSLAWINRGTPNARYSGGFTNVIPEVLGSAYAANDPVLTWLTGLAVFDGAGLMPVPDSYNVTLAAGNLFTLANSSDVTNGTAALKLTAATGKLAGKVKPQVFSGNTTPVYGVVLQNLDIARGYYTPMVTSPYTNQSGAFNLDANP